MTFSNLLSGRSIRLSAWGFGSNALKPVLDDLVADAGTGSTSKLLPVYNDNTFPDCGSNIMNTAFDLVDDNGILPLRPVGEPSLGLPWEQFSLPAPRSVEPIEPREQPLTHAIYAPSRYVNYKDFEADVDGSTRELILGLTWTRGSATLEARSPGGTSFVPGGPGTRKVTTSHALALKIPSPQSGTWRVRVHGGKVSMRLDLMARGVLREFDFLVDAKPAAPTSSLLGGPLRLICRIDRQLTALYRG